MDAVWVGVVGTVMGALVGGGMTFLLQRDQARSTERTRWHNERHAAYTRFLLATEYYEACISELRRVPSNAEAPWDVDAALLDERFRELAEAMTTVQFLGSWKVTRAALELAARLVPTFTELNAGHRYGPYGWATVQLTEVEGPGTSVAELRFDFMAAARRELGLQSEGISAMLPIGHSRDGPSSFEVDIPQD